MPNTCVAAGCSDFAEPSKSIGLEIFSEDNEFKRNRRRLYIAFVRTKCAKWYPQLQHAHVRSILKPMISKAHLL